MVIKDYKEDETKQNVSCAKRWEKRKHGARLSTKLQHHVNGSPRRHSVFLQRLFIRELFPAIN